LGSAPFGVRRIDGTVRISIAGGEYEAAVLDENGYDAGVWSEAEFTAGSVTVALPPDFLYTVVRRVEAR
ncbi:hypothetical protein HOK31_04440, partial [Candidatus Poribacteria bacterium]|nr:hypothetical protein [Candidatus Poribacteria bacterium]